MSPTDSPDRSGSEPPEPEESQEQQEQEQEPLNRAERRAQRRGKRQPPPDANGPVQQQRHPVVVPRRASRRGNR
jgi:hypothetical protein